ncbi:MAG: TIGR00730 family Rossman fold protein [Pseudomonadota bacterium]
MKQAAIDHKRVCVFCGSREGRGPGFAKMAQDLGVRLAKAGIGIVYGGGSVGLMGVLARAALGAGGEVIGVIPQFLDELEVAQEGLTRLEIVDTMHQRKARMFALADAFAVLPGGTGTLDETFEIATWAQLRLHAKPIYLLDHDGYWQPFIDLIEHVIAHGFADPANRRLFEVVPTVDDMMTALGNHRAEALGRII